MQVWSLWQSINGCELELAEVPLWTEAVSRTVEYIDVTTDHFLCGCGSQWAWQIPLGKPHYISDDDDRVLVNSLGQLIYDAFIWAFTLPDRHKYTLDRFAVDARAARALGAEFDNE